MDKKSSQLGMPFGTACNRLRKQLMFNLVKQLNKAVCFRCNKPIESIDKFSIDHKQPWLDESPELFWDLDNISFSHKKCNISASRRPFKKIGPDGTLWCYRCKKFLPKCDFNKDKSRWSGHNDYCNTCRNWKQRNWRKKQK
jgi:hypothetical protein